MTNDAIFTSDVFDSPNETYGNYSISDNQESPLYTAKFDYHAQGDFDPS